MMIPNRGGSISDVGLDMSACAVPHSLVFLRNRQKKKSSVTSYRRWLTRLALYKGKTVMGNLPSLAYTNNCINRDRIVNLHTSRPQWMGIRKRAIQRNKAHFAHDVEFDTYLTSIRVTCSLHEMDASGAGRGSNWCIP